MTTGQLSEKIPPFSLAAGAKGLVTNYGEGGATKREWGAREVLPLRKGGAEKVLAMLKGGTKSFGVVFTR